ncbi:MAG: hypothetical protein ACK58N_15090 [Synechocystis sp.]|jgi:hypothetical protein
MSLTSKVGHHSDGSELIPSEAPLEQHTNPDLPSGYVQDEEGVLDNYALEPTIAKVALPSSERLILSGLGVIAIFFSLIWIVSVK